MSDTRRLRIFAGPNGSGKSSIIRYLMEEYKVNEHPVDLGAYINADDIAQQLLQDSFSFANPYHVQYNEVSFIEFALSSGLLSDSFTEKELMTSFSVMDDTVTLQQKDKNEAVAQFFARYLRELLLLSGRKFSFETVFSHESTIDFMQRAKKAGYKVYLYFVATESAEINVFRVRARVAQGGHDVPEDKIRSRYKRSLGLLYPAASCCYRAYFFDNSESSDNGAMLPTYRLVATLHCPNYHKEKPGIELIIADELPAWFIHNYLNLQKDR